jgi:hypothetical protein
MIFCFLPPGFICYLYDILQIDMQALLFYTPVLRLERRLLSTNPALNQKTHIISENQFSHRPERQVV